LTAIAQITSLSRAKGHGETFPVSRWGVMAHGVVVADGQEQGKSRFGRGSLLYQLTVINIYRRREVQTPKTFFDE